MKFELGFLPYYYHYYLTTKNYFSIYMDHWISHFILNISFIRSVIFLFLGIQMVECLPGQARSNG